MAKKKKQNVYMTVDEIRENGFQQEYSNLDGEDISSVDDTKTYMTVDEIKKKYEEERWKEFSVDGDRGYHTVDEIRQAALDQGLVKPREIKEEKQESQQSAKPLSPLEKAQQETKQYGNLAGMIKKTETETIPKITDEAIKNYNTSRIGREYLEKYDDSTSYADIQKDIAEVQGKREEDSSNKDAYDLALAMLKDYVNQNYDLNGTDLSQEAIKRRQEVYDYNQNVIDDLNSKVEANEGDTENLNLDDEETVSKYLNHDKDAVDFFIGYRSGRITQDAANQEKYITMRNYIENAANSDSVRDFRNESENLRAQNEAYDRTQGQSDRYALQYGDDVKNEKSDLLAGTLHTRNNVPDNFDERVENGNDRFTDMGDISQPAIKRYGGENAVEDYNNMDAHTEMLTSEEKGIYSYLFRNEGEVSANAYLDSLKDVLQKRASETTQEYIDNASGAEKAVLLAASVPMNVYGTVTGFAEDAANIAAGKDIHPYSEAHSMYNIAQQTRSSVADDIDEATNSWNVLGFSAGDAFQAAMSIPDFMLGALTPSYYAASMSMGAAQSTAKELWEEGATNEQIVAESVLSGAAEYVFEKVSLDKILDTADKSKLVKSALAGMAVEGSEEANTEIANIISDVLVRGSQSEWNKMIQSYKDQGYSDSEAQAKAFGDMAKRVGYSAIGGAIGGAGGGAGVAVEKGAGYIQNKSERNKYIASVGADVTNAGNTQALLDTADQMKDNAEVQAQAEKVRQAQTNNVEKGTESSAKALSRETGKLYAAIQENNAQGIQNAEADEIKAAIKQAYAAETGEDVKSETVTQAADAIYKSEYTGEKLTRAERNLASTSQAQSAVESVRNNPDLIEQGTQKAQERAFRKYISTAQLTQKQETKADEDVDIAEFNVHKDDGKVYTADGRKQVDIASVASIGKNDITFALKDGQTESAKALDMPTKQAVIAQSVLDVQKNMGVDLTPEIADTLYKGYEQSDVKSVSAYMQDAQKVLFNGYTNNTKIDNTINLPQGLRNRLYSMGRQLATSHTQAQQQAVIGRVKGNKPRKGSVTFVDGIKRGQLDSRRRAGVDTVENLAKSLGFDVVFYRSTKNGKGRYSSEYVRKNKFTADGQQAPSGFWRGGKMYLDINAGMNGEGLILFTASHELVHMIREGSPEAFQELADFLVKNYAEQGVNINDLVLKEMSKSTNLTRDEAFEEVIAESCETFLRDTHLNDKAQELYKQNPTLWSRIREALKRIINSIKEAYAVARPQSEEARITNRADIETLEKAYDLWTKGIIKSAENLRNMESERTDTKYQGRAETQDTEYLDAVERGDMETAQRMVDEAAKEAGYNTPMLYHGTQNFGFTEFDLDKMDDKISIFLTSTPETASTYSGVEGRRRIGQKSYEGLSGKRLAAEIKEKYRDEGRDYDLRYLTHDEVKKLFETVDKETYVYKSYELKEETNSLKDGAIVSFSAYNNKPESVLTLFATKRYLLLRDSVLQGNYALYAKLKNPLVIDAKGANWNDIRNWRGQIISVNNTHVIEKDNKYWLIDNTTGEYFSDGIIVKNSLSESWDKKYRHQYLVNQAVGSLNQRDKSVKRTNTRRISQFAKENGYDGVIFKNLEDNGGQNFDAVNAKSDVYVVFDSAQVKSADPVTYDDNGDVVPLSERFNESNKDIRYQSRNSTDNIAYKYAVKNEDTARAQKIVDRTANRVFANSKVRGKDGKLRKVYHYTNTDFYSFDTGRSGKNQGQTHGDGIYISTSPDEFSYAGKKRMTLYANITNPFEMELTEDQARDVLEKYAVTKHNLDKYDGLYRNHAMNALQSPVKVFDYLKEYAKDNDIKVSDILKHLGFDGVHDGSEWVAFESNQLKSADPVTYDDNGNVIPLSERFNESNKDIRFSLRDNVEETRDLIAVHNLTEEKLLKSLRLGGLPMPSVAVIKAENGHKGYGDISIVFPKETIDPSENRNNKLYGGDVWSPTYPSVDYEIDLKQANKIYARAREALSKPAAYKLNPVTFHPDNIADRINSYGGEQGFIDHYKNDYGMKQFYLAEQDQAVPERYIEKRNEISDEDKRFYQFLAEDIGQEAFADDWYSGKEWRLKYGDALNNARVNYARQEMGSLSSEEEENIRYALEQERPVDTVRLFRRIQDYLKNGGITVDSELDSEGLHSDIDRLVDQSKYEEWLKELFNGIEKSSGIYNGTDYYTSSGNRRSFAQTHYTETLANVVRVMKSQENGDSFFSGNGLWAIAAKNYGTIEEMKADKDRLTNLSDEERREISNRFGERFTEIASSIANDDDNEFLALDNAYGNICDAVLNTNTKSGLLRELQKYHHKATVATVDDILDLVSDVGNMPVNYFEAKPQRAIKFNEVSTAVIPDNASQALRTALDNAGVKYIEYAAGNEEARTEVLNSLDDVKFQSRDDDLFSIELSDDDTITNVAAREFVTHHEDMGEVLKNISDIDIEPKRVDSIINRVAREYLGSLDAEAKHTLSIEIQLALERVNNTDAQTVSDTIIDSVRRAIEKGTVSDERAEANYKDFLNAFKGKKFYLTDEQINQLKEHDMTLDSFRKAMFGKMTIVKRENAKRSISGGYADAQQLSLEGLHDVLADADAVLGLRSWQWDQENYDAPYIIKKAFDDLNKLRNQSVSQIYSDQDIDDMAVAMSAKITGGIVEEKYKSKYKGKDSQQIRQALASQQKQTDDYIANLVDKIMEKHEAELADQKKQSKQKLSELKQKERERAEKREKKLTEHYKEQRAKSVEMRNLTKQKNIVARKFRSLDQKLNRADKDKTVKEGLRPTAAKLLEVGNMLFPETRSLEQIAREGVADATPAEQKLLDRYVEYLDIREKTTTEEGRKHASAVLANIRKLLSNEGVMVEVTENGKTVKKKMSVTARERMRYDNAMREYNGLKLKTALSELEDAYRTVKNSSLSYIADSYDPNIVESIQDLRDDVGNTLAKDMTAEQLKTLNDIVTDTLTSIKNANKSFTQERSITDTANAVIRDIKNTRVLKDSRFTIPNKAGEFLAWNNFKPIYAMRYIGSDTFTDLFWKLQKGESDWYVDIAEAKGFKDELDKKYGVGKLNRKNKTDFNYTKKATFTALDGSKFTLNLDQMMDIYAASRREQALQHLTNGGFTFAKDVKSDKFGKIQTGAKVYQLTAETIDKIVNTLTPNEKSYVEEMQEYLSTVMADKGNEVSMQLHGLKLFNEETYWSISSTDIYAPQSDVEQEQKKDLVKKIRNAGFTKKTVKNASNPIVLQGFETKWSSHVNDMSLYHSMTLPLEDFTRVANYKERGQGATATTGVRGVLIQAYGNAASNYINQLIDDLNGGIQQKMRVGLADNLVSLAKKGAVLNNLSVVIQQPSAVFRAMAYIDKRYFMMATGNKFWSFEDKQFTWNKHNKMYEDLIKYAPVAGIKRMGSFDTGAGRGVIDYLSSGGNESLAKRAYNKGEDIASFLPEFADELAWLKLWQAVQHETKAKYGYKIGSEENKVKSGERFTEVVHLTQVYDSTLSRSQSMRGKDFGSKMLTAFMAEPTTYMNMAVDAVVQSKRTHNFKQLAKTMSALSLALIANALLVAIPRGMRDDDDDETFDEKYMQAFWDDIVSGVNPLNYFPVLKDVSSIVFENRDPSRMDLSVVSDTANTLKKAYKNIGNDNFTANDVIDIIGSAATWGGITMKNLVRDIRSVVNTVNTFKNPRYNKEVDEMGLSLPYAYQKAYDKAYNEGYSEKDCKSKAESSARKEIAKALKDKYLKALKESDSETMSEIMRYMAQSGYYNKKGNTVDDTLKEWRKGSGEAEERAKVAEERKAK